MATNLDSKKLRGPKPSRPITDSQDNDDLLWQRVSNTRMFIEEMATERKASRSMQQDLDKLGL